jgi:hypothetical protein
MLIFFVVVLDICLKLKRLLYINVKPINLTLALTICANSSKTKFPRCNSLFSFIYVFVKFMHIFLLIFLIMVTYLEFHIVKNSYLYVYVSVY